jgi:hypothetical protein
MTHCNICHDTRTIRIDLPRDQWIPMKDGTYHQRNGEVHECVRGVSQTIRKPCPAHIDGARMPAKSPATLYALSKVIIAHVGGIKHFTDTDMTAMLEHASFMASVHNYRVSELLDYNNKELERRRASDADARRWRALIGCARMHFMGCAGFEFRVIDPEKNPKLTDNMTPVPRDDENYLNFGMEFWSRYAPDHNSPDRFEREMVTAFVDHIIKENFNAEKEPEAATAAHQNAAAPG